jgi:hypothetical protein
MKNIHLLPTDKPSNLTVRTKTNELLYSYKLFSSKNGSDINVNQHIYITSDEEKPKAGEWSLYQNKIHKCIEDIIGDEFKKIILTTDQDLIADGVQAIDNEFLEWFVNNPSCESVVVNFNYKKFRWSELNKSQCYKIIIPQEEPKQETLEAAMYILQNSTYGAMGKVCDEEPLQETLTYTEAAKKEERIFNSTMMSKQETLEEAAERLFPFTKDDSENRIITIKRLFWIEGAKWQQEQDKNKYSEEEVRKIAEEVRWQAIGNPLEFTKNFEKWFEQFKKK